MTPVATLSDTPDEAAIGAVLRGLSAFNEAAVGGGPLQGPPLFVFLRDGEAGEALGGLVGRVYGGWLYVELLYLPEALRGGGWGRRLMGMAEEEARRRGLFGIRLSTYSFQARGFYEGLGYAVYGELPDCPPGHVMYALAKRLAPLGDA
ncbi:GNAT family N-acetyltransferase [Muricoccus radiodurans]|uniref:GNAT family N-acetyltransferase n=1 Tax=Muricoccus radiodurans TaxID=2231721 RepID=UPI003CE87C20